MIGSFSWNFSVRPKLWSCALKFCSVKPSQYAQSCIRLCATNRFTVAALSSHVEPGGPFGVGSQSSLFHEFVHL